jgi:hypothetical protein
VFCLCCINANEVDVHRGPILLASTLNGTLVGISKHSGTILWSLEEGPVLTVDSASSNTPLFLPNPQDGSLYTILDDKEMLEVRMGPERYQCYVHHILSGH